MSIMRSLVFFAILLPAAALAENIYILSSAPPVDFLVKSIGGDTINSTVLIKPGRNPQNDEPSPRLMQQVSKARLWFRIGLPFEQRWQSVIRNANPQLRVIHLANSDQRCDDESPQPDSAAHHHGHCGIDPHIWTDPVQMLKAAKSVHDALAAIAPEETGLYERNFTKLSDQLKKLDADIRAQLEPYRDRAFLVYHPAWGHFAKRYGLRQIAMEHEGKSPGPKYLTELARTAGNEGIHTIFLQKQFNRASAETLAHAIAGKIVLLDPLSGDYLRNMRITSKSIAESMQ